MRANARRFLLAVVLAAACLGLNVAFPDLGPTGIPAAVTRLIIHGIILVGLWLGLSRTDFTGGRRGQSPVSVRAPFALLAALFLSIPAAACSSCLSRRTSGPPPR